MEFCYARVGRGIPQTTTDADGKDVRWRYNARAAAQAGLALGGYWRFFPSQDLARQLDLFVDGIALAADPVVAGWLLRLPPMVDIEDDEGLASGPLTDWAITVLQRVEELTGVRPVLYTGAWFLDAHLEWARLIEWPLALARWTPATEWPDPRATWWQHAGNVTVPWATGPVDLQRHRGALT